MFENIIAQNAASQLCADFQSGRLAPSMLFYGPRASGKGSTALELARALSCGSGASWNCACPSCIRHRCLMHVDLLCLGKRAFSAEIAAARAAFLREPFAPSTATLFMRSVRKLMARFSPVLMENNTKLAKIRPLLESLEEALAEFEPLAAVTDTGKFDIKKAGNLSEAISKHAIKLDADGMNETIPVEHIRQASYWARIAPAGRRKVLLIENSGSMKDAAKNSLLKILEEPPDTVTIILCAERRHLIMPTLLSRLRQYRFIKRDRENEIRIIRRVFQDSVEPENFTGLPAYLDSFLAESDKAVYGLAAFFAASVARCAAHALKKRSAEIPDALNALGLYCAPIADDFGFKKVKSLSEAYSVIMEKSAGFENMSFSQFIKISLDLVSTAMRQAVVRVHSLFYIDVWRKYTAETERAVSVYNQNPALAMEALFYRLITELSHGKP